MEAGGEDGSSSVSRVLGSVSGLFALLSVLSAVAPTVGCNVTFLAALIAFDAGLNLLSAFPGRLFLPFYIRLGCWVVPSESVDKSSETYPFPPRPGFFSCCPMVAASAVSGSLRLGVSVDVSVSIRARRMQVWY